MGTLVGAPGIVSFVGAGLVVGSGIAVGRSNMLGGKTGRADGNKPGLGAGSSVGSLTTSVESRISNVSTTRPVMAL